MAYLIRLPGDLFEVSVRRSQKAEVRRQKSEGRGQKTENRGQRSEGRGQKTGGWRAS